MPLSRKRKSRLSCIQFRQWILDSSQKFHTRKKKMLSKLNKIKHTSVIQHLIIDSIANLQGSVFALYNIVRIAYNIYLMLQDSALSTKMHPLVQRCSLLDRNRHWFTWNCDKICQLFQSSNTSNFSWTEG